MDVPAVEKGLECRCIGSSDPDVDVAVLTPAPTKVRLKPMATRQPPPKQKPS